MRYSSIFILCIASTRAVPVTGTDESEASLLPSHSKDTGASVSVTEAVNFAGQVESSVIRGPEPGEECEFSDSDFDVLCDSGPESFDHSQPTEFSVSGGPTVSNGRPVQASPAPCPPETVSDEGMVIMTPASADTTSRETQTQQHNPKMRKTQQSFLGRLRKGKVTQKDTDEMTSEFHRYIKDVYGYGSILREAASKNLNVENFKPKLDESKARLERISSPLESAEWKNIDCASALKVLRTQARQALQYFEESMAVAISGVISHDFKHGCSSAKRKSL